MSYPDPPDWNNASPLSAWYLKTTNGQTAVCSSNGWDMLSGLQSGLHDRLTGITIAAIGPLPTYDGSSVLDASINDPSLTSNTGWDVNTLKALYAVAQNYGVDQSYLSAIQSDATSGATQVSQATLQTGLWIADRLDSLIDQNGVITYGNGSPSVAEIPSATLYPSTTAPPPVSTNASSSTGQSLCNAITPAQLAATPVQQSIIPFVFDEWMVFGVLCVAAGVIVVLTRNVPVRVKTGG